MCQKITAEAFGTMIERFLRQTWRQLTVTSRLMMLTCCAWIPLAECAGKESNGDISVDRRGSWRSQAVFTVALQSQGYHPKAFRSQPQSHVQTRKPFKTR